MNTINIFEAKKETNINLETLLGKEGVKLYHLALEEEMNSQAYRDAVCTASTTAYKGEKWLDRPIVFIAGPSGCGKSFAAKTAINKLNDTAGALQKGKEQTTNYVIAIDNGIARETSQMRKLAIQLANSQGYTGIKDLHKQSNAILQKMKGHLKSAVLTTENIGIVIPETFARWKLPFWNPIKKLLLNKKNKCVFCHIQGQEAKTFESVVQFLGDRRAWKTKDIKKVTFGLNESKGLAESKSYQKKHFNHGLKGSLNAANWVKKNIPDGVFMTFKNDLQLMKKDKTVWRIATQDEADCCVISKRAYEAWKKTDQKTELPEFSAQFPAEIEIDTASHKQPVEKSLLTTLDKLTGFTDTQIPVSLSSRASRLSGTEVVSPQEHWVDTTSQKKYPSGEAVLSKHNNIVTDHSKGIFTNLENEEIALKHALQLLTTCKTSTPFFKLEGANAEQIQKVHATLLWFKLNRAEYKDIHVHSNYGPHSPSGQWHFFKERDPIKDFIKSHLKSNLLEQLTVNSDEIVHGMVSRP